MAAALLAASGRPAGAQPKMLFVGDSITVGVGASDPATRGFVALLAERFSELEMANAGCDGSSVRDWTIDGPTLSCALLGAWDLLAAPELPAEITHVMLGTNDAVGFFEFFPNGRMRRFVPPEEYEERLGRLVERAPGLVLLSTPPRNPQYPSGPVDDRLRAYRDAVLQMVASERRVVLGGDFYTILDPSSDLTGPHPNDRGHAIMADVLERSLLAALPRGALAPCRNPVACLRFRFLPQYPDGGDRPGR